MEPGVPAPPRRQGTVLESVEEIRAQIRASPARTVKEAAVSTQSESAVVETPMFRPTARPPMGLLHVLDDGDGAGAVVRVYAGSFVIGRVEGNLVIPHDSGMSGRHAEIVRRLEKGAWTWHLRDLGSTNGTFARASTVTLHRDQEFMIGGSLFRFEEPVAAPAVEEPAGAANATRKWEAVPRSGLETSRPGVAPAALVEISQGAERRRYSLTANEYWLGRDARTSTVVVDDPYVDPRHARLYRDDKGRWIVANERSRNGLWGRVAEIGLGRGGFFQCGEQRFLFKAL